MFEEKNTRSNLPAQIDLYQTDGDEYKFLFMAKGVVQLIKHFFIKEPLTLKRRTFPGVFR